MKQPEADGWYEVRGGKASHRQYRHPRKSGAVTVAGHDGKDMPTGTLGAVLRQAGLKR
ncbi:MAG TPA: type II toxin-antitoxin system HicA family toxin [Dehalococcoidia bacterium]|nr:type II toxin-antitoxin system HicA family toxin [Dehalococcoidia bacterium]